MCLKLIKRGTKFIYWFIAIINLTYVFNLETMLPHQGSSPWRFFWCYHQNYVILWRSFKTDTITVLPLSVCDIIVRLSVNMISLCVYHTSVLGYHNRLCNPLHLQAQEFYQIQIRGSMKRLWCASLRRGRDLQCVWHMWCRSWCQVVLGSCAAIRHNQRWRVRLAALVSHVQLLDVY